MIKYKKDIGIIGLGRFGSSVAKQLRSMQRSIVLIDNDEINLRPWANQVTSAYIADATDIEALKKLGVHNLETVIVAAPDNIEIVASLLEINVKHIIARATSIKHARVLKQIGVDQYVLPEEEAGIRTALIAGSDSFIKYSKNMTEMGGGFVMTSTQLFNNKIENKPVKELNLTKRGISIVLIKSGGVTKIPTGDTILKKGDLITLIGPLDVINDIFEIFNKENQATAKSNEFKDTVE
ncbi:TrkA family potassium uptake protein [Mycoplasmopsis agassizii]|uniref:TrkA family potassium uptake protein n=1 Tax=Mycoplasmopsis agassizii TaxID=33922 RepID=A0A1W1X0M1_9BACT|nr:TrkA family potassium uptake protein [Mycoplasmopsis agassizii]PAF55032.1 TrkA family potassium uptake protein [Mycoplasmopsis agassizii]PAK21299.1 TrkA family potassium uptake protein [Mycoplasmopsis agassizii]SMC17502.1 trk system potassium uptake protein TrkA [Mycoplasmopsis agassizii]